MQRSDSDRVGVRLRRRHFAHIEFLAARAGRLRNENIFSGAEIADYCSMVDGALKVVSSTARTCSQ